MGEKETYINDICLEHMLEVVTPKWKGLPVIPSKAASRELDKLHFKVRNAVEVLEEGFDCERSGRKKGTIERCIKRKGKTIKVVVVRSFNRSLDEECWLIIHAGKFK